VRDHSTFAIKVNGLSSSLHFGDNVLCARAQQITEAVCSRTLARRYAAGQEREKS
jgi:hypothetical protein